MEILLLHRCKLVTPASTRYLGNLIKIVAIDASMSDIQTWRAPLQYLVTLALAAHDTLHMRQGPQTCHNVTPHASEPIIFFWVFCVEFSDEGGL